MQHQDWDPVIIRSSNKQTSSGPRISTGIKKVEDFQIPTKPQTLTGKSRSDMAQIRVSKGWTQKQLDMNGQFPANSCNGWESGKLCPTGPQLQKLHRVLGIKLERE